MKRTVLLVPFLAWTPLLAQSPRADSLTVRTVALGFADAVNARGFDAALAFCADSAILHPPGELGIASHDSIRARFEAFLRSYSPAIEMRIDKLWVAGDWALVRGHLGGELHGQAGTADRELDEYFEMIVERRPTAWRITQLSWQAVPKPPT